jgi:hypothetical protein
MNVKYFIAPACASLILLACSTPKPQVDTSASHPTSVLKAKLALTGVVLPQSHGEQWVYTRATERNITNKITYDSWLAAKFFNSDNTQIGLTEKNLSWILNNTQKTYIECPLYGCADNFWQQLKKDDEQQDDTYEPNTPKNCELTSSINYDVVDKKVSRVVNGFNANQYQLVWSIENKDKKGMVDSHKVVMDFWMTTPTENMQAAWKINGQFQQNYLAAVGANDSPMGRMLGQKVYMTLASLSGDTEKSPELKAMNSKLAKLEGYPVSIKLEWYAQTNACKDEQKKRAEAKSGGQPALDFKDAAGSLKSLAGGLLKDKAKETVAKTFERDPSKPLIRYIYDVESIGVADQRDSIFAVPPKYKLENRQ